MCKLIELTCPCHFGMEAVLKREIIELGYDIVEVDNGRVTFLADEQGIMYANIFLRTAERVLIRVGKFKAENFDELFENIFKIDLARFIPKDAKFWVTKASSINSKVFSPSDIQSIAKKAMVKNLSKVYGIEVFEEDGEKYPFRISINKDIVSLYLDTTGVSLHKRGYRQNNSIAPISETLAASMILLSFWNRNKILIDPFCGCGTIPIEAALIGKRVAPGLNREFLSMYWDNMFKKKDWDFVIDDAKDRIIPNLKMDIQGYDIDSKVIEYARINARLAGVEDLIHFQQRDVSMLNHRKKYGVIITNPPYGERIEDEETLPAIYTTLNERFRALENWSLYMITSYEDATKYVPNPTKNRKLYNGMIKTYYYQYIGEKPRRDR